MHVYVIGSVARRDKNEEVVSQYIGLGCEVRRSYDDVESGYTNELIMRNFHSIRNWADLVIVVPTTSWPVIDINTVAQCEMAFADFMGKPVVINWNGGYHDQG